MPSSFHSLNVGPPTRSDEEGWAAQSSTTSTTPNPSSSSSPAPRLRRALLVALLGSLAFAAIFASGLAVLRSLRAEREGERGRGGGPHPARPLSEVSPLPQRGAARGDGNSSSLSSSLPPPPPLRFLVIGDWGRQGNRAQREVAAAMTRRVREVREAAAVAGSSSPSSVDLDLDLEHQQRGGFGFHPSFLAAGSKGPEFVLTVGDNFYQSGLLSAEDPAFEESFVDVYSSPELVRESFFFLLERRRRRPLLAPFLPDSLFFLSFFLSSFIYRPYPGWECWATTTTASRSRQRPRRRG